MNTNAYGSLVSLFGPGRELCYCVLRQNGRVRITAREPAAGGRCLNVSARDGLSSSSFLAWSSIAQSVCQRASSLLAIWCLGPRVQILHSAEEHNLSPFDLNIACLCQSIEINNNKYVYRQSQVRKLTDSGVKWAECSLIIGTGCRVQVF